MAAKQKDQKDKQSIKQKQQKANLGQKEAAQARGKAIGAIGHGGNVPRIEPEACYETVGLAPLT